MEYYLLLLLKILIVIVLTDVMDLCSFYRKRNQGYFCIKQYGVKRDAWHDSKLLLLFFVFGELVKWDILLLILAAVINYFVHELILFGGFFKKFINNVKKGG